VNTLLTLRSATLALARVSTSRTLSMAASPDAAMIAVFVRPRAPALLRRGQSRCASSSST
jgi:hypothetical protein